MQNSEEQATPLDAHHSPLTLEDFNLKVDHLFTSSQVMSIAFNFKMYFVIKQSSPNNQKLQEVKVYDLKNRKWSEGNTVAGLDCIDNICPTLLMYLNKVTLFANSSTMKAGLYSFDEHERSWTLVDFSEFSSKSLDVKNSACYSYGHDGVVVVTVFQSFVYIHLFLPMRKGEIHWKSAKLLVSKQIYDCQIQSCFVASNYVFCTLLTCAHLLIYKVDLNPLQHNTGGTCFLKPENSWLLDTSNVKKCFLSILSEEVVTIMVKEMNNKKVVEVSEIKHFNSGSLKPLTTFNSVVNVVAATIVPDTTYMAAVYYDSDECKLSGT